MGMLEKKTDTQARPAETRKDLQRQQPGRRHWRPLWKCVTPGEEMLSSGRRVCRVAPHYIELEAVTRIESGDCLEEVVHASAAAAAFAEGAEGAERDAAVRQSEYPAIPATF